MMSSGNIIVRDGVVGGWELGLCGTKAVITLRCITAVPRGEIWSAAIIRRFGLPRSGG